MERDGMNSRVREQALIAGPVLLVCLGAVWLAFQFVEPAPPKVVKMTTGSETGGYFKFGQRYAERMKAQGIKLEIATSAGSIENIKRLNDAASGFKLGLVQGGISNSELSPDLVSIGRVFLEPLWVSIGQRTGSSGCRTSRAGGWLSAQRAAAPGNSPRRC